jgi:hypothetical protein
VRTSPLCPPIVTNCRCSASRAILLFSYPRSILYRVGQDHRRVEPDRLTVAALTGAAQRHAGWGNPTESETAAAVAELEEILAGRDDGPVLLAEVAGILLGFGEGQLDEAKAKSAAELCRLAGADEDLIARWIKEGRKRAANAALPPFSRPRRRQSPGPD